MRNNEDKYFKVSTFYVASYLLAKGMELVGINREDPQQCIFIFLDIPEREQYLRSFNFGRENNPDVLIDARKLVLSIKKLKEVIYQKRF